MSKITDLSIKDFAAQTAAKQPTPGGGSVAAAVGSLAAALGEMSVNYTTGKKKFAEFEPLLAGALSKLGKMREMFIQLVSEDAEAFALYESTANIDDENAKQTHIAALTACVNVPREMSKLAVRVLNELEQLNGKVSKYLVSDLACAAILAEAVTRLADLNVRINLIQIQDKQAAAEITASSRNDIEAAEKLLKKIQTETDSVIP